MPPPLRKLMLTLHVTTSVGLLGAVAGFLILAVSGLTATGQEANGLYLATDLLARLVIVPLAVAALGLGLVESLFTRWGLVQHYWLVAKLILTTVALLVLLLQLPTIAGLSAVTKLFAAGEYAEARAALVLHSAGGLLVLLLPVVLSVYKPRGRTAYGRRKQQRRVAHLST